MNRKKLLRLTLIAGFVFLSLGGWLLHLRVHPPAGDEENYIPFIAGIFSICVLPALFWFRAGVAYAYVANGFLVIIGTITMAHFSIVHFRGPVTLAGVMLNTTLADIALLWGKFIVGKALFDLQFLHADADTAPGGRFFRYPNMGWWWVHLAGLSVVYSLGNVLW
jgi:hypothetical protein